MGEQRCCKSVPDRTSRWPRSYQCQRRAVVERDGNHYCRQHDPEAVKARDEERARRWRQERDAADEKWRRQRAAAALLKGVPTEVLESPGFAAAVREAASKVFAKV